MTAKRKEGQQKQKQQKQQQEEEKIKDINIQQTKVTIYDTQEHKQHHHEIENPDTMSNKHYMLYCHDLEHQSIWTLGTRLNCADNNETISMSFVVAIALTLIIEIIIHKIEHYYEKYILHTIILNTIYKELMLMGLLGLIINLAESIGLFELLFQYTNLIATVFHVVSYPETEEQRTERRIKIFEFVHVNIFFLSLFYVGIVFTAYFIMKGTWTKWAKYDKLSIQKVKDEIGDMYKKMLKKPYYMILYIIKWLILIDQLTFCSIKARFLKQNKLSCNFEFSRYLKIASLHVFADLIEISSTIWGAMWVLFFVNYVREKLGFEMRSKGGGLFVFIGAIGFGTMVFMTLITYLVIYAYYLYVSVQLQRIETMEIRESVEVEGKDIFAVEDEQKKMEQQPFIESMEQEDQPMVQIDDMETTSSTSINFFTSKHVVPTSKTNPTVHIMQAFETLHDKTTEAIKMTNVFTILSPKSIFFWLQVCLLVQSLYLSLLSFHFMYVIFHEVVVTTNSFLRVIIAIFSYSPAFVVVMILFPLILPMFVILHSVGNLTKKKLIKETLKKEDDDEEDSH